MIRSISLVVAALLCALWGSAARAQMSQADLLTRIDRIEAALRELTGTVEQLQYRNQQLEQQLRALQDASQTGARPPASPRSRRHARQDNIHRHPPRPRRSSPRRRHLRLSNRSRRLRRPDAAVVAMHSIRRLIRLRPARHVRSAPARPRPNRRRRLPMCHPPVRASPARRSICPGFPRRHRRRADWCRAGRRLAAAAAEQSERYRRHAGDLAAG